MSVPSPHTQDVLPQTQPDILIVDDDDFEAAVVHADAPARSAAARESAQAVAARLRLIQQDMAGQPDGQRRAALVAAISDAADAAPPRERDALLDRLETLFPAWGEVVDVTGEPEAGLPDRRQWNDPETVVRQLARLASNDPDRRVERLLIRAGLSSPALPDEPLAAVRRRLGLVEDAAVEPGRLLELLAETLDAAILLDELVAAAWPTLARTPGAPPGADGRLRERAAHFAALADRAPERPGVAAEIGGRVQNLVGRIRVMLGLPRAFAKRHAERFAPVEIEQETPAGGFGRAGKLWDRYVRLAGGPEREHVEDAVAGEFADILVRLGEGLPPVPAAPPPAPAVRSQTARSAPRRRP